MSNAQRDPRDQYRRHKQSGNSAFLTRSMMWSRQDGKNLELLINRTACSLHSHIRAWLCSWAHLTKTTVCFSIARKEDQYNVLTKRFPTDAVGQWACPPLNFLVHWSYWAESGTVDGIICKCRIIFLSFNVNNVFALMIFHMSSSVQCNPVVPKATNNDDQKALIYLPHSSLPVCVHVCRLEREREMGKEMWRWVVQW